MKKIFYIVALTILFNISHSYADEVATYSVTASVVILPSPDIVNTPVINDVPTETCNRSATFIGLADADTDIYVDGVHETTSNSSGNFTIDLVYGFGTINFSVYGKRGDLTSSTSDYTFLSKNCTGAYTLPYEERKDLLNPRKIVKYIENRHQDKDMKDFLHIPDLIAPKSAPIQEVTLAKRIEELDMKKMYDDSDSDGVADFVELLLHLNLHDSDSDSDGVNDVEEIVKGRLYTKDDLSLYFNLYEHSKFVCNDLLADGKFLTKNSKKDYDFSSHSLKICLQGDEKKVCFQPEVSADGMIFSKYSPQLIPGDYTMEVFVDNVSVDESDVSCVESTDDTRLLLTKIDFLPLYSAFDEKMFKKRSFIFALRSKPIVDVIATQVSGLYSVWMQNGSIVDRAISMTDENGFSQISPSQRLKTFFGFGRYSIVTYASQGEQQSSSDDVAVYIFDLYIIIPEMLLIYILRRAVAKYAERRRKRS